MKNRKKMQSQVIYAFFLFKNDWMWGVSYRSTDRCVNSHFRELFWCFSIFLLKLLNEGWFRWQFFVYLLKINQPFLLPSWCPSTLPFNYHIIIFSFIYSVLIKTTLKGVQGGLHILNVEAKPNTGDLYF